MRMDVCATTICVQKCSPLAKPGSGRWWLVLFMVLCCVLATQAADSAVGSSTAYACEDGILILECQRGEVIRILRANYGRFTISICNQHGQTEGWNLQCMSSQAKDIISERCDGRRRCEMHVNNHVFGDPCPLTTKYAEVKYTCQLAPETSMTTYTTTTSHAHRKQPKMPVHGSPRPPHITSVEPLSPYKLKINWTQEAPSNPIITTVVYLTDQALDMGPSSIYTMEKPVVISQLRPNTTYTIYMKSFNSHGPSVSSNIVTVNTLPKADDVRKSTTPTFLLPPVTPRFASLLTTPPPRPPPPSSTTTTSSQTTETINTSTAATVSKPTDILSTIVSSLLTIVPTILPSSTLLSTDATTSQSQAGTSDKYQQLAAFIKVASSPGRTEDKNGQKMARPLGTYDGQFVHKEMKSNIGDPPSARSSREKASALAPLDIQTTTDCGRICIAAKSSKEKLATIATASVKLIVQTPVPAVASEYGIFSHRKSWVTQAVTDALKSQDPSPVIVKKKMPAAIHLSQTDVEPHAGNTETFEESRGDQTSIRNLRNHGRRGRKPTAAADGLLFRRLDTDQAKTLSKQVPVAGNFKTTPDVLSTVSLGPKSGKIVLGSSPSQGVKSPTRMTVFGPIGLTTSRTGLQVTHTSGTDHIDQEIRGPSLFTTTTSPPTTTTTTTPSTTTTTTKKPMVIIGPTTSKPDLNPSPIEPEIVGEGDAGTFPDAGVVDKFCPKTWHKGVVWPQTRFGRIAEGSCPEELRGGSTWRCLGYGWEKSGPDMSYCISPWLDSMDMQINNMIRGEEPVDQAAMTLRDAMRGRDLTSGDLKQTAMRLLPKLAQGLFREEPGLDMPARKKRMRNFKKALLETTGSLLKKKNLKAWEGLTGQDRRRSATSMVLAVEETGFQTAKLLDVGVPEVTVDDNIVLEVSVIDTEQIHHDMTFPSTPSHLSSTPWHSSTDSLTITSKSLKGAGTGTQGLVNLVFTMYTNMEELMQPQWNTVSSVPSGQSPAVDGDTYYNAGTIRDSNTLSSTGRAPTMVVNTRIIAASINNSKMRRQLSDPVRFTLHHLEPKKDAVPVCSFWDLDTSYLSGQWSQDGCRLLSTNSTHTECECDHLTNFAVLMDISGAQLSEENELALRVITYVGCVISIICLVLSWVTFMVFKNLQCDRNTIHKNLVLSLLLAEILFLGGIAQTELKVLCSIIAGALHYLFLAAFAWMCLEGVQLYVMLIEVFEQEKSRVHWYYLFGYGVPAVIVAVSAGIYHQGYGTDRHCWLTTDSYFIWSFVGPALIVMLINIGMLSIAIYTMCRHSNMSPAMRERSKVTKFSVTDSLSSMETFASPKLRFPELPAWVKGAIVLVVLLGLTWLLGVLYLNKESVVMAYCFTVLNSLQGLFIFVFHCLKNEKVQKEYRKVARRTSWLPNCIRVNYGGYTGVASSSPVGSSGTGNYLSKLFGGKTRKRSAASTNSSAKPFLSKDQQRRSDTDHSSSKDSSNIPSSLNGYVYNPSYSNPNGVKTPFLTQDGVVKSENGGQAVLTPCYETVDGLAGDLSEYVDCSVVDSEFVSEYCKHNMQVSSENHRYSTGSEDSQIVEPTKGRQNLDVDNLSNLSLASSSRRPASCASSVEMDRPRDGGADGPAQNAKHLDLRLDLHQYIIPKSKKSNNNNNHLDVNKSSETDRSASMNKLDKTVPSLSSIPETDSSPQHSSTPNLQFRPELTTEAPESPVVKCPDHYSKAAAPGDYEEENTVRHQSRPGKPPGGDRLAIVSTDSHHRPLPFSSSEC